MSIGSFLTVTLFTLVRGQWRGRHDAGYVEHYDEEGIQI